GESANYIGARSVTAAIKPDIKLQPTRHVKTMDALQTGCVHINYIGARSVTAAIKPDIKLQPTRHVKTMDALQTGCVHIKQ
ncbi:hypothetical protein, partial [Escherichia coli]|uniref:hypothetical protein n=1 Tax=Escherichia coli TaxID=562 RepID=UPI001BDBA394